MKICVRCGQTPEEVKRTDSGGMCVVYGKNCGNHKYKEHGLAQIIIAEDSEVWCETCKGWEKVYIPDNEIICKKCKIILLTTK